MNSYEVTQYLYGFACLSMHGYVEKAEICSAMCTQCTDCMKVAKVFVFESIIFRTLLSWMMQFKDVANISFVCNMSKTFLQSDYVNRKAYRDKP